MAHKALTSALLHRYRRGVSSGQSHVSGIGAAEVLDVRLLGPVEVRVGEQVLDIGGPKQRALLAVSPS